MKHPLAKIPKIAALPCVVIGLTHLLTVMSVLDKQRKAVDRTLTALSSTTEAREGLRYAPALLKRVFIAADERGASVFCIAATALGGALFAVGIYVEKKEAAPTSGK